MYAIRHCSLVSAGSTSGIRDDLSRRAAVNFSNTRDCALPLCLPFALFLLPNATAFLLVLRTTFHYLEYGKRVVQV